VRFLGAKVRIFSQNKAKSGKNCQKYLS
jgi:hypothetical protein